MEFLWITVNWTPLPASAATWGWSRCILNPTRPVLKLWVWSSSISSSALRWRCVCLLCSWRPKRRRSQLIRGKQGGGTACRRSCTSAAEEPAACKWSTHRPNHSRRPQPGRCSLSCRLYAWSHVLRGEFPAPPSSRRQHHAASPTAPRPGAATPRYHWTHLICEEVKLQAWCCRPPLHEMLLIMGCGLFVHTASLAGASSSSRCSAQRVEWLVTILNTWICICIQIFTFQSRLHFWDELPVGRVPESQSMDLCLFSCSDSFQLWGWVHGFSFTTQPLCSGSSQTGVDKFQTFFFFFFFGAKFPVLVPVWAAPEVQ